MSQLISQYLTNLQGYLSTVPLEQGFALLNILLALILLVSVFNIAIIFYGDFLIVHLDLELKYPRLTQFISFRRRLQQHYFNRYLILLLLALSVLLVFNLLIFFQ